MWKLGSVLLFLSCFVSRSECCGWSEEDRHTVSPRPGTGLLPLAAPERKEAYGNLQTGASRRPGSALGLEVVMVDLLIFNSL